MKLILFFAFCFSVSAQAYEDSITSATGGTGRASVEAAESPFLNPATIAYLKGYYFTAGGYAAQNSDSVRDQGFAFSLTDNQEDTLFPSSLAFNQVKSDFASPEIRQRELRLSVAEITFEKLAGGLAGHYQENRELGQKYTQTNVDAGLLYAATSTLGFAAMFENVLGQKTNIDENFRLKPRTSVGLAHIYKEFLRTKLDLISSDSNSWNRPTIAAGLESFMNHWLVIRIGYQKRNQDGIDSYSAGAGFVGPRFGVHYAYSTSPESQSLGRHAIDMAIPIW